MILPMANNNGRDKMLENEVKLVMVSRLLTPEQKAQLLARIRLAHTAESSVRNPHDSTLSGIFELKTQEYSCTNILHD